MRIFTLALLLLVACLPVPTDHPAAAALRGALAHTVDAGAVAVAKDTRCDDQPDTLPLAMAALTVPIVETRLVPGGMTSLPWVLLAKPGWSEMTDAQKLMNLQEELAHYCQRRTFPGFDQLWLTGHIDRPCKVVGGKCSGVIVPRSDYRAAFEIAAKRAAGITPELEGFTRFYLLHDLQPASLQALIEAAHD